MSIMITIEKKKYRSEALLVCLLWQSAHLYHNILVDNVLPRANEVLFSQVAFCPQVVVSVSVHGVFVQGVSVWGASVQWGLCPRGLCLGEGSLSKGVLVWGRGLCPRVSWSGRPPVR